MDSLPETLIPNSTNGSVETPILGAPNGEGANTVTGAIIAQSVTNHADSVGAAICARIKEGVIVSGNDVDNMLNLNFPVGPTLADGNNGHVEIGVVGSNSGILALGPHV